MFTDEIFGFKKLEDGKWEIKTFSFYRMCRYGMKSRFQISIVSEKYKKYLKLIHVVLTLIMIYCVSQGKTLHRQHNVEENKFWLIFFILFLIYFPLINFLTTYYVHKSNEHSTTK